VATRTARRTVRALAALVTAGVTLALLPRVALADPSQATLEAKRRLAALNVEIEVAAEHYNDAQIALAAARREAARAQARVGVKAAEVSAGQRGIGRLAAAAYRTGGGVDPLIQLMTTATPQSFLTRAGTLDAVSRNQGEQLRALRAARRSLEREQDTARQKVAAADDIAADLATTKATIERSLAEQQQLVERLETADARRERLEREAAARRAAQLAAARERARQIAAAEAARRASLRASRNRVSAPSYRGPASGRASVAVAEAYRQLGKPYQWAAAGPDRFDCSGLTMWVWAKAGVSLPHSSRAQFGQGHHVSWSELQPGDLTFYGSPIHHVGIYVGNGNMINAPQTGDVVKVAPAMRSDYVGAVRL
jgi:cell wall-associated NlpC family hydrolase